MNKKAVLIRIDRIGDLVLTLPSDQQPPLDEYDVSWFISSGLGFVASNAQPPRKFSEWKKEFSWRQFFFFVRAIQKIQPDVSVSFQSPWWVNLALWMCGVPRRIGVLSQWHSFLFLNHGVRQKRSLCEFHELEYNHRLIQEGFSLPPSNKNPTLDLTAAQPVELPKNYMVVHPGMSGSALNWPIEHYQRLIEKLSLQTEVIITGTASDQFILQPLRQLLKNCKNIHWLNEKLKPAELLTVLQKANAVFAPSTGVIHLAASLGTPTLGIYSPVKVQTAQRWGPQGRRVTTWTPSVNCPGHFKCLGDSCEFYNCMKLVSPEEIYENMSTYLTTR